MGRERWKMEEEMKREGKVMGREGSTRIFL